MNKIKQRQTESDNERIHFGKKDKKRKKTNMRRNWRKKVS